MAVTTKPEPDRRVVSASADASFEIRRLTLDEYHRLIDIGFFPPTERVELIEGILHCMIPRGPRHAECLKQLLRVFVAQLGSEIAAGALALKVQDPIVIPASDSEPEPDFALVTFAERDHARHPTPEEVQLVVEIADTSLDADRGVKTRLYAAAAIDDYWIVNLVDDCIEVYREPTALKDDVPTYRQRTLYASGDTLSPLHFLECKVDVGSVLPPRPSDS